MDSGMYEVNRYLTNATIGAEVVDILTSLNTSVPSTPDEVGALNNTICVNPPEVHHSDASIRDCAQILSLTSMSVIGSVLYAFGALLVLQAGVQMTFGPVRQATAHVFLLQAWIAGLMFAALHLLPVAEWGLRRWSVSESCCRLGRCVTDSLYSTGAIMLALSLIFSYRRPNGYVLTLISCVCWIVGPGFNFFHIRWRVGEVLRHADCRSCVVEELAAPFFHRSQTQSCLSGVLLFLAVPVVRLLARNWQNWRTAPLPATPPSLLPLLTALASSRGVSCLVQLLTLFLTTLPETSAWFTGATSVVRDSAVLLEAALLIYLYPDRNIFQAVFCGRKRTPGVQVSRNVLLSSASVQSAKRVASLPGSSGASTSKQHV